jgi:hypothetical protein
MFNPNATLQVVQFDDQHFCLVVDDALSEPERLVAWAAARRDAFKAVDISVYPGIYLMAPADVEGALSELFRQQLRRRFDARRCLSVHCRYSLVTLAPRELRPYQWICHVDNANLDPRQSIQASVLYLFKNERLGGTSFYAPIRSDAEIAALFKDARTMPGEAFTERYGIAPGYMNAGNAYFQRVGGVAPQWNRLIFYDGGMLHSSDIPSPDELSADPLTGRLTLNGFFTSRRNLA